MNKRFTATAVAWPLRSRRCLRSRRGAAAPFNVTILVPGVIGELAKQSLWIRPRVSTSPRATSRSK